MILISTEITQQTFVLLIRLQKTSWSRSTYSSWSYVFKTFSRRLQDVFKTSSGLLQDVLKTSSRRLQEISKTFSRRLQDVFKTSSGLLQDVLKTSSRRLQEISKTSSRRLQDVLKTSSRHLQHVFQTYYQVKVFLVIHFQDIFETYLKRSWDVLLRWLSAGGLLRSHFPEIYGHCAKSPRVTKISQVLVFHFTTPFSGFILQRCI